MTTNGEGGRSEIDLVGLAIVSPIPVRVSDAARVLDRAEPELLEEVESLVSRGVLVEAGDGFAPGPDVDLVSVGGSRRASLAGRLAGILGENATPAIRGGLLRAAGEHAAAVPLLTRAAQDEHDAEAVLRLVSAALDSGDKAGGLAPAAEGELRFRAGAMLRVMGSSLAAEEEMGRAARLLEGARQVDALGFASTIADDLQHPARSEMWVALAEGTAATIGEPSKHGSLLVLHARQLTRLGFPIEADAALAKADAILAVHGTEQARYFSGANRAWIAIDRGDVRSAEAIYDRLRELADRYEGEAGVADKDAYWSRTAFAVGDAAGALPVARDVIARMAEHEVWAPSFIAWIGLAEAGILYGRPADAVAAADRAHELAETRLPAWRNRTLLLRAKAVAVGGDRETARALVDQALELTPDGADGWRLRAELEAARLIFRPEKEPWPQREAETLTDELLQTRLHAVAVELMTERARREREPELGLEAAALARDLGNPLLALLAMDAAGDWKAPEASAVGRMVRHVRVPEEWEEEWEAREDVRAAVALEEVEGADELLRERIDEALTAAGLSGDEVLSPAQRRAAGLVRRRPVRRRRSLATTLAAALGVVVVAGGTAYGVGVITAPPTTTTTTSAPTTTTTTIPELEDRVQPPPEGGFAGTSQYRGGSGRSGVVEASGVREVTGRYWRSQPGGFFGTDLIAYGKLLYVGSATNDVVYALDQDSGEVVFTVETGDRVVGAPTVAQIQSGEALAQAENILVFGSDDGFVRAAQALRAGVGNLWRQQMPGTVSSAMAVAGPAVVVVTEEGRVLALDALTGGEILWEYPGEGVEMGRVSGSPALGDGRVFVADEAGMLHVIDAETGAPACDPIRLLGAVVVSPIVADGAVYVPTEQGQVHVFASDRCGPPPDNRPQFYANSVPIRLSPAVDDTYIYLIEEQRLLALKLDPATYDPSDPTTQLGWGGLPYNAETLISTPPTVANGILYLGTQTGEVHAVDTETGERLWVFRTGSQVVGAPAVVDGAVFVTTADGTVWAIAGEAG